MRQSEWERVRESEREWESECERVSEREWVRKGEREWESEREWVRESEWESVCEREWERKEGKIDISIHTNFHLNQSIHECARMILA